MALSYSTKLKEFLQGLGSMKRALEGGVFELFAGDAPANADAAETGTKRVSISLASGTITPEVLASGTVTLSGANGQVSGILVNSVQIMSGAVVWDTDLATTAAAVADNINKFMSSPDYEATSSAAVITIKALSGTGTGPNGYVVATTVSGGTLGKTDVNLASGVAEANGLTYGGFSSGVLTKAGIWSGVIGAGGVVGYFRIKGSIIDAGAADTDPFQFIRIQGTCGTSGADYDMGNTTLVLNATHTIDTWTFTAIECR